VPRRLSVIGFLPLLMVLLLAVLWSVRDWPPPRLILKYGFPPTGGPTGRTLTIEAVEFVEWCVLHDPPVLLKSGLLGAWGETAAETQQILRGGAWQLDAGTCRSAARRLVPSSYRRWGVGFRPVGQLR
jgi:hypothetical protein